MLFDSVTKSFEMQLKIKKTYRAEMMFLKKLLTDFRVHEFISHAVRFSDQIVVLYWSYVQSLPRYITSISSDNPRQSLLFKLLT